MSDQPRRRRGRPPLDDASTINADCVIGMTVHRLVWNGWPLRSTIVGGRLVAGVAQAVGTAACDVLKRADAHGKPLGGDRIEQIYERWKKAAGIRSSRARFTKRSLKAERHMPNASLASQAAELIRGAGLWPGEADGSMLSRGDLDVTPKVRTQLAKYPRIARD